MKEGFEGFKPLHVKYSGTETPTETSTITPIPTFTPSSTPVSTQTNTPTATPANLADCIPILTVPAAGAILESYDVTFRWLPCEGRVRSGYVYNLYINGQHVLGPIMGGTIASYDVSLLGPGPYEWSVDACSGSCTMSAETRAFEVVVPSPTATSSTGTGGTGSGTGGGSSSTATPTPTLILLNGTPVTATPTATATPILLNGTPVTATPTQTNTPEPTATTIPTVMPTGEIEAANSIVKSVVYYAFNGQPIAMHSCDESSAHQLSSGCSLRYLHSDHLGSVVMTTDLSLSRGSTKDATHRRYDAYGVERVGSDTLEDSVTDHTYTGQKADGTGLMYYNARYYDPQLGLFISPDSIVPDPTNLFAYNRYMYVAGNPMRLRDSSGHIWETIPDILSVGYDIYDISQNGLTWSSAGSLAVDVGAVFVPGLPAPGACVRWCDDVIQYGDEALEYGRQGANWVGNKIDEGVDAVKRRLNGGDEAATASRAVDCLNSFSGDTLVMTPSGTKPISELVEGEFVLAYNEETGEVSTYPIIDTISHMDPEIVLLTIDGEVLETTSDHPFYELETAPWLLAGHYQRRWTDAIDLSIGDLVWQADGTTSVVESVKIVPIQQQMYNLTVDTVHTFFVGQYNWLVHNADCLKIIGNVDDYSASELDAARHLADIGNDVVLRPPSNVIGQRTSDLLVNGLTYDVYTPKTANASRIISAVAKKNSQAQGIVLDLSQTKVNIDDLGDILARVRGAGATNISDIIILGR